ncbi:aminopeptidase, partial [bacterium]|nr:aminopeptidase [bacterium]
MKDPRIAKVAKNLIRYSTHIQPGENILIELRDHWPLPLVHALIEEVKAAGGRAFVNYTDYQLQRKLLLNADDEWFDTMCEVDRLRMKKMQAYISINGRNN